MPFKDELDFITQSVFRLANQGGFYRAPDAAGFWQLWQKHGGWWQSHSCLTPPVQVWSLESLRGAGSVTVVGEAGDYPFHLLLFPGMSHKDLQVELHPQTAQALGLHNGRQVKLVSPVGQIQATVRLSSQLACDVLAIPWSMWSLVWEHGGQAAPCNPLDLFGAEQNSSGNLAFTDLRVQIEPL
jgi:anaerobic selenocysteine-containing dehydrogenase